ncbi:hypothetical protein [Pseudomonas rhodesiae]|uniref:hypothetical protein n=1 Tax=Pseudomonas rhodesiae TaxID=76760 RepID=UPI0028A916B9|nr:hypothetical protein [Pseudomonas rhodesiae]
MNTSLASRHPLVAANRQSEAYKNPLPMETLSRSQSTTYSRTPAQTVSTLSQSHTSVETTLTLFSNALNELMTALNNLLNRKPSLKTLNDDKPRSAATELPRTTLETTQVIDKATVPQSDEFLSGKKNGEKPDDIWGGLFCSPVLTMYLLSAPLSSHVAGIKLVMQRFGQSPRDIFSEVTRLESGFNITMRDGFKLHITFEELKLAQEGCQMLGDEDMLKDAAFLFGALVKRKQIESFNASAPSDYAIAMWETNKGESAKNVLELLGMKNHIQSAKSHDIAANKGLGIVVKSPVESLAIVDGLADFNCTPSGVRKHQQAYLLT